MQTAAAPEKRCVASDGELDLEMKCSDSFESMAFDALDLHPRLLRGIRDAGFETPRPIQAQTIPAAISGRDVLGLAQTGTGKTAAFAIPILDVMLNDPCRGPSALVVAPTRELASQIERDIKTLARSTDISTVTLFGGVSQRGQVSALRRDPDIIVGCPGRILDLLQQKLLHLDGVDMLVLDEADHMFDMGFLPDVKRILAALPQRRQNMLFSATMPPEIRKLADALLNDAHVVELEHGAPVDTIDHALYPVSEKRKRDLLNHLLGEEGYESAIVFTRTKHRAKRLADQLSKSGHRAVGLQGNMSQGQRDRAMRGFRDRSFDILVATDIAARGIDVTGVSHVINFDVPNTPDAYTHRIGRTGRSGREGRAYTFVTAEDHGWVRATEKMIGSPISRQQVPGFSEGSTEHRAGSARPGRGSAAAKEGQTGSRHRSSRGGNSGASNGRSRSRRVSAR